jgi:antitoxin component YwqK of YwqJK toxin-antitoxin module
MGRTYYDNGSIEKEINYHDGRAVGMSRTYYENGNIRGDANYKDGRLEGIAKEYYDSGEIKYIDTYKDGEHIDRKEYDKEGKLKSDQDYSNSAGK